MKYSDDLSCENQDSNLFEVFQALVSTNFERVIFGELQSDLSKIKQIEEFARPKNELHKQFPQFKSSHFVYSRKTADILLMNMLITQEGGEELLSDLYNKDSFRPVKNDYE